MGVDVEMYARLEKPPSDELMAEVEEFFRSRLVMGSGKGSRPDKGWEEYPYLEVVERDDEWFVELRTLDRYWGPGYERGDWPSIYGYWRAFEAFWPGQVYYHGDGYYPGEVGEPFSAEKAEAYWEHWSGPHGDDYAQSFKRMRERWKAEDEA